MDPSQEEPHDTDVSTREQGETETVIETDVIPAVVMDGRALVQRPIGLSDYDLTTYANLLETVRRLRSRPETIDLVLSTQDGGIEPVHRYYLALKAPQFWAQIADQLDHVHYSAAGFSLDMYHELRTAENIVLRVPRILVPDIDRRMLQIVVDTMYAGSVRLDYDLSWQLLELAHKFKLDFLATTCLDFLQGSLNAKNCVHLLQVGLRFGHKLAQAAYKFVLHNFVEVLKYPEMVGQLSVHQIRALLLDNELDIGNEMYAWRAVAIWVDRSPAERIVHFWPLFGLVRWQLMHSTVLNNEIVRHFSLLNMRLNNALADKTLRKSCKYPLDLFNPRVPRHVVFVYGGYEDGLPSSTLKVFDIRAGLWFRMNLVDSQPLVYHSMVAIGHKLYILGGSDGLSVFSHVRVFNALKYSFRERKPMSEPRCYAAAVCYRNSIVVIGGNNGKERLRTVEMFEPSKNHWRPLASMNSARSDAAAAVHQDKIYVAGGVESFGLSSVEFYSFQSRTWTVVSFMNLPRRSFALVPYADTIYAIGGCTDVNEYTCLRSVERLNPVGNQWQFVGHMHKARSSFVAGVLEGKLFVFGGYDGFSTCKSVESYHNSSNRWEKVSSYVLPTELSGAALALLSDLPTAMHCTYYGQCALTALNDNNCHRELPLRADPARGAKQIGHLLLSRSSHMCQLVGR